MQQFNYTPPCVCVVEKIETVSRTEISTLHLLASMENLSQVCFHRFVSSFRNEETNHQDPVIFSPLSHNVEFPSLTYLGLYFLIQTTGANDITQLVHCRSVFLFELEDVSSFIFFTTWLSVNAHAHAKRTQYSSMLD